MSADICLVPTFRRPEYLWLCLEQLEKCEGVQNLQIVITIDNHLRWSYDPEVLRVARAFATRLPLQITVRSAHHHEGNSTNVLLAYGEALAAGARHIFLVEDDILVLPDFFRWHYAIQDREPEIFASVASPNKHVADWPRRGVPGGYFTSAAYASHGVCLPARSVELLVEHITSAYLSYMPGYLAKRFPHSRLGPQFCEQDGLIDRIIEERSLRNAWPCAPRAFHTGFWGYHRTEKTRPGGSLEKKVAALRQIVSDTKTLNSLSVYYHDLDGLTSPVGEWYEQTKVAELGEK
jgi:hypothetical protein